jgi:hypothetical protein
MVKIVASEKSLDRVIVGCFHCPMVIKGTVHCWMTGENISKINGVSKDCQLPRLTEKEIEEYKIKTENRFKKIKNKLNKESL